MNVLKTASPEVFKARTIASSTALLIFLMACNMVAGVLILPCYLQIARPRFIFGGGQTPKSENGQKGVVAAF